MIMNTEYIFPKWFHFPSGIAFIYLFNTSVQLSKESNEEVEELKKYFIDFPENKPSDEELQEFKNKLKYVTNLCILCDGYDPTIDELNIAYDKVIEYIDTE